MIKVHLDQKEVIRQIQDSSRQHDISDFIMELTGGLSQEFTLSLIERLKRRDRNGWYGKVDKD